MKKLVLPRKVLQVKESEIEIRPVPYEVKVSDG